ncbi:ankyrin repeat domain-containing protein [uncultured Ilyobacter sp.]|uniref:ankyrin repeat domain-containing protein n=1 Tax=uncultured Ilyobacter sp. TaxID=544433 RepID=UPI0029C07C84|nr:ankyrin repeat domain-containing protein [uncultured Ilyobacter sp.]
MMELLNYLKEENAELFKENLHVDLIDEKDENGYTFLHHAVTKGNYEIVDFLIYNGVDVNVRDKRGNTPVHLAAELNEKDIFQLLLEYGGDLRIKNNNQRTPEQLARMNKSSDVLKTLENYSEDYGYCEKMHAPKKWDE